jgi:hypothetical protein
MESVSLLAIRLTIRPRRLIEWAKIASDLVGRLAWPGVSLIIACLFRPEIRKLVNRLRKLHGPGFDLETEKIEAQQLEVETLEIREEHYPENPVTPATQRLPASGPPPAQIPSTAEAAAVEQPNTRLLDSLLTQAVDAPKAIVVIVRQLVETELRKLFALSGYYSRVGGQSRRISLSEMLTNAKEVNLLSPDLVSSVNKFTSLADAVVHGTLGQNVSVDVITAGLNIVNALRSIPSQRNFVYLTDIPIYSDSQCSVRTRGHGIVLEALVPPNGARTLSIFPTTRSHFQKGKEVAWEWNMANQWGETWYRNEAGQIATAWGASAEFIGRHLEDI